MEKVDLLKQRVAERGGSSPRPFWDEYAPLRQSRRSQADVEVFRSPALEMHGPSPVGRGILEMRVRCYRSRSDFPRAYSPEDQDQWLWRQGVQTLHRKSGCRRLWRRLND